MRKLRGLQTLSLLRGEEEEEEEGGHRITSRPASALGKQRPRLCFTFFPLTRLYMCAVIKLQLDSAQRKSFTQL